MRKVYQRVDKMSVTRLRVLTKDILSILYYDTKTGEANPDKEWTPQTLEMIGEAVEAYGLTPEER
jgi:hypothetical protein